MKKLRLYVDFQSKMIKTNNQNDDCFCNFYEAGITDYEKINNYDNFIDSDIDNYFLDKANYENDTFDEVEVIEVKILNNGYSFEILKNRGKK